MENYLLLIINTIYYLIGKDTYKYLKSYPNLIEDLNMVANTLRKLVETKNDDTIIVGHHTHNEYKLFKSHLYDIISAKYVILNDGFKKQAVHNESSRIVDFKQDMEFINSFIHEKFDVTTVTGKFRVVIENPKFDDSKEETKDNEKLVYKNVSWIEGFRRDWNDKEHSNDDVLTPQQWNIFWEEIINVAHKDKSLENLECRALTLNQIPGVLINPKFEKESLGFLHFVDDGLCTETFEEPTDKIPKLHDFKNETEYPLEFAIIKGCTGYKSKFVAYLSPNKLECTEELVTNMFDIHSYLFSDL